MEWRHDGFVLTDDKSRLDLEAIMKLLALTYWARERPRHIMQQAMEHSLCLGLLLENQPIGFARVVTDRATFAWLCDVIIHPGHRGKGLGKWMMHSLLTHPQLQTVTAYLRTEDAHPFYEPFGFLPVETLRRPPLGAPASLPAC